jgi:hypothetical protein
MTDKQTVKKMKMHFDKITFLKGPDLEFARKGVKNQTIEALELLGNANIKFLSALCQQEIKKRKV